MAAYQIALTVPNYVCVSIKSTLLNCNSDFLTGSEDDRFEEIQHDVFLRYSDN